MHLRHSKASAECSICLDDIDLNSAKLLSCGHYFHHSCWNNLVRRHSKCPMCRRSMVSDMKDVTTWYVTICINENERQCFEIPLNKHAESFMKNKRVRSRCNLMFDTIVTHYEKDTDIPISDSYELYEFASQVWISMQVGPFHTKHMICLRDTPLAMQMALYDPDLNTQNIAKKIKEWMRNYF